MSETIGMLITLIGAIFVIAVLKTVFNKPNESDIAMIRCMYFLMAGLCFVVSGDILKLFMPSANVPIRAFSTLALYLLSYLLSIKIAKVWKFLFERFDEKEKRNDH